MRADSLLHRIYSLNSEIFRDTFLYKVICIKWAERIYLIVQSTRKYKSKAETQ